MKQGGDRKASWGFTIVEVLIVLAVTGSLFLIAVLLVNGRQNKTAFQTAINNLQQQIQQVINETASGYYPNSQFQCAASGASVTITAGSNAQGTNGDCILVGKVLQFGTDSDSSQLVVYPLAGRKDISGTPNLNITSTNPVALYPDSSGVKSQIDATATAQMENGLQVAVDGSGSPLMFYNGATRTGAIGFLAGDSTGTFATPGTGGLSSGSQQLSLYAIKTTTPNIALTDMANAIDSTSNLVNASSATICIASATTDQSGLITITDSLAVTLQIKAGKIC